MPGPVPFCEISPKYHKKLAELNVPCQFGYGLCRISATGKVTPCTISDEVIGDLRNESFKDVWNSNKWDRYLRLEHLPVSCRECDELRLCRGGCVVYDQSIRSCGLELCTKKWQGVDG